MAALLHGDWESEGALRLEEHLTRDDLAGADILADARTLLAYVEAEGPVKETKLGYLLRAAVTAMRPRLELFAYPDVIDELRWNKVVNESDVSLLLLLRHVLEAAGLLTRRKRVIVSRRGRELLHEERGAELYVLLFRALFQKVDLRALGATDDHAGLQPTVAYTFYKLGASAREWASDEHLAETAWLESAKDPLPEGRAGGLDLRYYTLRRRVLDPLVYFGLLEQRRVHREGRVYEHKA